MGVGNMYRNNTWGMSQKPADAPAGLQKQYTDAQGGWDRTMKEYRAANAAQTAHLNSVKALPGISGGTNTYAPQAAKAAAVVANGGNNAYTQQALNAAKSLSGAPNSYDRLMVELANSIRPGSSDYDQLAKKAANDMMQTSGYEMQLADLLKRMDSGAANPYEMKLNTLLDNPGLASANPAYQFALDQGAQNMSRQAAASGNRISGRALAEATDYGQGKASEQYFKMSDFLANMVGTKDTMNNNLAGQLRGANDSWNSNNVNRFNSLSGAANDQRTSGANLFSTYNKASDSKRDYDLRRFGALADQSNDLDRLDIARFGALSSQSNDQDRINLARQQYLQSPASLMYQDYVNPTPNNPGYDNNGGFNRTYQKGNSYYGQGFQS